jgi:hypothetical protein
MQRRTIFAPIGAMLAFIAWSGTCRAQTAPEDAGASTRACPPGHAPVWSDPVLIGGGPFADKRRISVKPHRTVNLDLYAEDADGDPLSYSPTTLPPGARYDVERRRVTWVPTERDLGENALVVAVSDGCRSATLRLVLSVVRNVPPEPSDGDREWVLSAGARIHRQLARDFDADKLTVTAVAIPRGARVTARQNEVWLDWQTSEAEVGTHQLILVASDGELSTEIRHKIVIYPAWASRGAMLVLSPMPGYGWQHTGEGTSVGPSGTLVTFAHMSDADDGHACMEGTKRECAPGMLAWTLGFEVLYPTRPHGARIFTYSTGLSRSLEFGRFRRWLIPLVGVEGGGLVHERLGHFAQTLPYAGVHLWADRHVWVDAAFGYRLVPARLRQLSGPRAGISMLVNAW